MNFVKRTFFWAGVYGLLCVGPQLFLESKTSRDYPPAITHPEFYYGFVGVTIAWQLAFLLISRDPVRHRPLMPACMVEKAAFAIAVPVLFAQGRVPAFLLVFAAIDALLGVLFVVSWLRTPRAWAVSEKSPVLGPRSEVPISSPGEGGVRT